MPIFLPVNSAASGAASDESWERPADWLALPAVISSDRKLVGLYAVFPHDSNFVAVNCAGAYTIDWGDGSATENISSGVQAQHNYTFSSISSSTTTSEGYRQVIITITPQGATWTTLNLGVKHNQTTLQNGISSHWLDIAAAGSTISSMTLQAGSGVTPRMLEQFTWVGTNVISTWSSMFSNCGVLQSIPSLHTGSATNMTSMFSNCRSLKTNPTLTTTSVTNMSSMFSGCSSLSSVTLTTTGSLTDTSFMFNGCAALKEVSLFTTSGATAMNSMFNGCSSLQIVPHFVTTSALNMSSMFGSCTSLKTIPLFNTATVTNMSSMFTSCTGLDSVPQLNTSAVTNITSMFSGCTTLSVGRLAGTEINVSYASCRLSATELENIFIGLADLTSLPSQAITITGNWGAALLIQAQRDVALNKNWTITG